MALANLGQSRSPRENIVLAFALATVAGCVNSVGFHEFAVFTSNLTGSGTRLGESLASRTEHLTAQTFVILLGFLSGAMTATLLVERATLRRHARYVVALLVEAVLITGVAIGIDVVEERTPLIVHLLSGSLAFAMGLQNAMVTQISGAVVRTTHITGLVTDFGIESVRLGFHLRQKLRESESSSFSEMLQHLRSAPNFVKARLLSTIFFSFVGGAFMSTLLHAEIGHVAMALPVGTLLALVAYDRWSTRPHRPEAVVVPEERPLAEAKSR